MTIQSVANLQQNSNKLLNAVCSQLQEKDIAIFSSELIALRNEVEDIKDNKVIKLIADLEVYKIFGECQNAVTSAQSKLVKKALQLFDCPKEFYNDIEVIWKQIKGENVPFGLGQRLAKTDRKNPNHSLRSR